MNFADSNIINKIKRNPVLYIRNYIEDSSQRQNTHHVNHIALQLPQYLKRRLFNFLTVLRVF